MTPEPHEEQAQQQPDSSPQADVMAERLIETLFQEPKEALQVVNGILQEIDADAQLPDTVAGELRSLCHALTDYHRASSFVLEGSLEEAVKLFTAAEKALGPLDDRGRLRDFVAARRLYYQGLIHLQQLNFAQALSLYEEVMKYGDRPEPFRLLQHFLDGIKPDYYYLIGLKRYQGGDLHGAVNSIAQAASAAYHIANQVGDGTPGYHFSRGQALYYQAYADFLRMLTKYNQFAYDAIVAEKDMARTAREARASLENSRIDIPILSKLILMCRTFENLLLCYSAIANLMDKILQSTFKPAQEDLDPVRQQVRIARELAAQIGPEALFLIQSCDAFEQQVNNLERLAKPTAKDFGVFGGLIACALFAGLLLITLGANWLFGTSLQGAQMLNVIYVCVVLAVAGGFGVSGLKYIAPKFFPSSATKKSG